MSLEDQLKGVIPSDPPPDNEPVDPPEPTDPPKDPPVDADKDGDGDDKDKSRSIENVHRELSRKQEQFQVKLMDTMMSKFSELTQSVRETAAPPPTKTGDSLDDKTVDELKGLRSQVPEENRAAFEDYLTNRIIDESVKTKVGEFRQTYETDTQRRQTAQQAVERYPQLLDKSSDFRAQVDLKLKDWGLGYVNSNPRAVLDAANEVATTMDITPAKRRPGPAGVPANHRQSAPVEKPDDEEGLMPVKKAEEIAKKLANAMPGKKFDIEQIRRDHRDYKRNIALYLRG